MRIDKFIWSVRLFKTRSLASKAVDGDKVKLNNQFIKPGKVVQVGDSFAIKVNPIWKTYTILAIPKSRVGAKLVVNLIEETTSTEDTQELENLRIMNRQNGLKGLKGRPTKRDRRKLDNLGN